MIIMLLLFLLLLFFFVVVVAVASPLLSILTSYVQILFPVFDSKNLSTV